MTTIDASQSETGPVDLSGDLVGRTFRGMDLRGVDLTGRDLTGADFSGADLSGARLSGATLRSCSFRASSLVGTHFVGADLTEADLTECKASGAIFGESVLCRAAFFAADLEGASLSGANATGADFRAAQLTEARLLATDLSHCDVSRASLVKADLTNAVVERTLFNAADLSAACLRGLKEFDHADWVDVAVVDIEFSGAYMVRRAIMDQNYLHEFRSRDRRHELLFKLWRLTSDCGRSFARWGILTAAVAVAFALLYTQVALDYGDNETILSPFYFSVVTLTTLGFGDVLPASLAAQILVLIEVVVGYVMLGGVLSIFATRMGRRAD